MEASSFIVIANGTADSIADIAEILGWLATAFASSPVDRGITYYRPVITQLPKSQPPQALAIADATVFNFAIRCNIHVPDENFTQSNSQCWHNLF